MLAESAGVSWLSEDGVTVVRCMRPSGQDKSPFSTTAWSERGTASGIAGGVCFGAGGFLDGNLL